MGHWKLSNMIIRISKGKCVSLKKTVCILVMGMSSIQTLPLLINTLAPEGCGSNSKSMICKPVHIIVVWALARKLLSGKCSRTV